ncbi:hypothetical protein KG091_08910 [Carnobacteriaceae bacterium zg-ZUI78]|nr:hypothetical protein [Carnobacteriaceae bacterium zg-ZUI78]
MDIIYFLYIIFFVLSILSYVEENKKKVVIYDLLINNEKEMVKLKLEISQQYLDKIKIIGFINKKYRLGIYFSKKIYDKLV